MSEKKTVNEMVGEDLNGKGEGAPKKVESSSDDFSSFIRICYEEVDELAPDYVYVTGALIGVVDHVSGLGYCEHTKGEDEYHVVFDSRLDSDSGFFLLYDQYYDEEDRDEDKKSVAVGEGFTDEIIDLEETVSQLGDVAFDRERADKALKKLCELWNHYVERGYDFEDYEEAFICPKEVLVDDSPGSEPGWYLKNNNIKGDVSRIDIEEISEIVPGNIVFF